MPKIKTLPDPSQLEKLIKAQSVKVEMPVELLLDCAGMCHGTYYKKVGGRGSRGQIDKLNLDELRRLAKTLRIPKEELMEAVWAAIRY